ncbi:hypothetical protein DPMN_155457 [Dreissena polymorpha]|uniref:Uncharacterized protein n=1 Tax=Dreissena polymorpha TaxID=45954 RepID=A0A9D4FSM1_DREPO|nr:hypothetical protein DPMN_155457 [Dreissena polymorpha]
MTNIFPYSALLLYIAAMSNIFPYSALLFIAAMSNIFPYSALLYIAANHSSASAENQRTEHLTFGS